MSTSSASATGIGDLAISALFLSFSLVAGILVAILLLVATSPLVAIFPPDSGASAIVLGIALLWGVVTGCVVAVFTLGSWRRLRARAQIEALDDAEAVPLELVGCKLPRRRIANDQPPRPIAVDRRAS
ncbi:MAG TPA: hypothetical protein VNF99_21470 [Stellaceae bacterium]|nr:hypothetical protein [Stellaceae bacterium]